MKLLLDTNAYSALKRGRPEVAGPVRDAERIAFSAVVLGELLFGFRSGRRFERNAAELAEFLASPYLELVKVSEVTADRFARIASELKRKGRPIPTNDLWIAAHAFESGAELLSYDRHFEAIDGLVWKHLQPG